mgnify:FL=1
MINNNIAYLLFCFNSLKLPDQIQQNFIENHLTNIKQLDRIYYCTVCKKYNHTLYAIQTKKDTHLEG